MNVGIVDYGLGNIKSVFRAIKAIGDDPQIVNTSRSISSCETLILPGVGAFKDGIDRLTSLRLVKAIHEYAYSGRPLLGICLGMQLFMSESEEFGYAKGLSLIPGKVEFFKSPKEVDEEGYRIPHVGWNNLLMPSYGKWEGTILSSIRQGAEVYFIHSCIAHPDEKKHILAMTIYGKQEFCSVVRSNNVIGCQFHPEKSGIVGLHILKNFVHAKLKIGGFQ